PDGTALACRADLLARQSFEDRHSPSPAWPTAEPNHARTVRHDLPTESKGRCRRWSQRLALRGRCGPPKIETAPPQWRSRFKSVAIFLLGLTCRPGRAASTRC